MTLESDQSRTDDAAGETAASVSYLDQALWQQLSEIEDPAKFASAWLALQCAMIASVKQGVVVLRDEETFAPVAQWPGTEKQSPELVKASEHALQQRKGVIHRPSDSSSEVCLAYPFEFDDEIQGIVAIALEYRSENQLRSVMRQLQWGASWFEAFNSRRAPVLAQAQNERLAMVIQIVATSLDHEGFVSSISAVATELATNLGCERVSIGFLEKNNMKVRAISHSSQFDKRSNLVRQIGMAMDEARDQLSAIVYPRKEDEGFLVRQAHEQLTASRSTGSVCTVLIANDGNVLGGITLEHKDPDFFTQDMVRSCEQIALVVGPVLELKRRDERPLLKKATDSLGQFAGKLLGEDYLVAKASAALLLLVIGYLSVVSGTYRVSADATLEGIVQRHISAPVDGYVAGAYARAGDLVNEGDPLFSLDDKDMQLEKLRWESQRMQAEQKYRDALASHDRAEASIQRAQLDQTEIQIQLIESQLARINATAPFDGIVVSGDLSQQLGAPVRKGDTLLQVAPLDGYRIILEVDEMDITAVETGQAGELSLSSIPEETFAFIVEKVTPEAKSDEGQNTFQVEAHLVDGSSRLRPGMQGTGKVTVGDRSLIWIWTHGFFDWLRIWLWSWWP